MKNENLCSWLPYCLRRKSEEDSCASRLIKLTTFVVLFGLSNIEAVQAQSQTSISGNTVAQSEYPMARISGSNHVYIRGNAVETTYRISVGHFGFDDVNAARNHFDVLSIDHVKFEAESKDYVLMNLNVSSTTTASWTVDDWNEHFALNAN